MRAIGFEDGIESNVRGIANWRRDRLAIAAIVVVLIALVRTFPIWHDISNRGFDLLSTYQQPIPEAPGVILVAIDEPSFSEIGLQWPWPREIHARLIASLRNSGARAIGFDIVFAEESDAANDAALIAAAGPDIVFAADETLSETAHGDTLIRTEPLPALLDAGAASGVISIALDSDGVARRIPRYPDAFARQLLRVAGQETNDAADGELGDRIQFFGPEGSYPRVSYYQALDPDRFLPPEFFRNAVVIVGYNLQASPEVGDTGIDTFESPYTLQTRRLMPGPEIHATIYDNILNGMAIAEEPRWLGWLTLFIGAVAGLAASLPQTLRYKVALAAGTIGIAILAAWLALRFGRVWVSPTDPAMAVALTVTAIGAFDFAVEQRRRREVQGAFSQYLSPAMVDRLVDNPDLLKLGGERKPLTILFADIRGFTSISEAMKDDPESLVLLINDILTPLTETILEHGGTIDKYIGDCIMAFWNAPLDDPDHARNAIAAARAMIDKMPTIREEVADRMPLLQGKRAQIAIGIGLNTGDCVVGNMGSKARFDYSVLGDPVNTASRLEAQCKALGVPVVIGESTVAAASSASDVSEIGEVQLKGRAWPVRVFTLAAMHEENAERVSLDV